MAVSYTSAKPYFYGTGRRKSSVARVRLFPGTGSIIINGKDIDEYFGLETLKLIINQPFDVTGTRGKFDIVANVNGGGFSGQAGAIRHGVARRRRDFPSRAQACRIPHARPSYEGKKEVRLEGCTPRKPVLQEIRTYLTEIAKKSKPRSLAAFGVFFCAPRRGTGVPLPADTANADLSSVMRRLAKK